MKKFLFTLSIAGLLAPTAAFAYGEGESIPYIGRAMHLLTNEVRTDVYAAIDACGEYCHEGKHCYKPSIKRYIGATIYLELPNSMPPCPLR